MDTYYNLLGVAPQASAEEISSAYARQRERYSPERVAALGDEFQRVAQERLAALDTAYSVLSDAAQRSEYDQRLDAPATPAVPVVHKKRGAISRRELYTLVGGAMLGVLIIAVVWSLAGRSASPEFPALAVIDRPAPDFTLNTLDGTPVKLSDYRGKTVLLNFWYTNCPPCKEETPALRDAHQRLADKGLVILGVNVRNQERAGVDGDNDIRAFAKQYGADYPIIVDEKSDTGRAYQVYVLPTTFFIDPNGTIQYARFGPITADEVERTFTTLQQQATAQR